MRRLSSLDSTRSESLQGIRLRLTSIESRYFSLTVSWCILGPPFVTHIRHLNVMHKLLGTDVCTPPIVPLERRLLAHSNVVQHHSVGSCPLDFCPWNKRVFIFIYVGVWYGKVRVKQAKVQLRVILTGPSGIKSVLSVPSIHLYKNEPQIINYLFKIIIINFLWIFWYVIWFIRKWITHVKAFNVQTVLLQ